MDRARAKRLLAAAKRSGKSETQARTAVAQQLNCSITELSSISFTSLTSQDCGDSNSGGGYDGASTCE